MKVAKAILRFQDYIAGSMLVTFTETRNIRRGPDLSRKTTSTDGELEMPLGY